MYFIGRIVPAGIAFGGIALYTHLLDPASFGTYALLLSVSYLIGLAGFSWLRVAALRTMSSISENELPDFIATMAWSFVGTSAIVVSTIFLALRISNPTLPVPLVLLTAAAAIASNWFELNISITQARIQLSSYGMLQAARAGVMLLSSVLLIIAGLKAEALLAGFVFGNCTAFWVLPTWAPVLRGRFRKDVFLRTFRFGWPSSAGSLSYSITPIQRYLLEIFGGSAAVGLLAVGSDFAAQTLGLLMGTVTIAGQPLAFRARDLGEEGQLDEQLRNNARLLFAVGLAAAVGLIVLAEPIAHVFFGAKFRAGAAPIIAITAASTFLGGLRGNYFDQAFEIERKTRPIAVITCIRIGATLLPSAFLIPRFGAVGAALSILIADAIALSVSSIWARCLIRIPVPLWSFAKIVAATAAMVAAIELVPNRLSIAGLAASVALGMLAFASVFLLMYSRQIRDVIRLPRTVSQVMTRP
jgi:O-antigen/teichoic acid export membrane protein